MMLTPLIRTAAFLALVAVAACNPDNAAPGRLSDTVAIDPAAGGVPSIALDELGESVWAFGGLKPDPDDELQLRGVLGVVELSDGRMFLNESSRLRLFDRDGIELWRHGREGAGPQEFSITGWPCRVAGDTIVLMDQRNARFAMVEVGRGTLYTTSSATESLREGACGGDGGFITTHQAHDSTSETSSLEVVRWAVADTGPTVLLRHPLPPRGAIGAGYPSAGYVDSMLYVADPNRAIIDLYTRSGEFVRTLRWDATRVAVTDENIPARYGAVPMGASKADLDAWWEQIRARPRTDFWPAFEQVLPDGRNNLWVRLPNEVRRDSTRYLVVSSEGKVLARVAVPPFDPERMNMFIGPTSRGAVFRYADSAGGDWIRIVKYPPVLTSPP